MRCPRGHLFAPTILHSPAGEYAVCPACNIRVSLSKRAKWPGGVLHAYSLPGQPAESSSDGGPWQRVRYITRDTSLIAPRLALWKTVTCGELLPDYFPDCTDVFRVYWIDGFYLRNSITVEFDDGGNPQAYPEVTRIFSGHAYRYTFIPDGEVWLEVTGDLTDTRDEEFVLMHEVYECHRMQHFGEGYEEAHGQAQHIEKIGNIKIFILHLVGF